ncbi:MAG TPA: prepilin-type N-terminal cleavage/methylation domain-containing protein [Gemmatimonadaceae bacterium]|nr:prepilin-type N-terminal cleavage/methylation domain-containing protein [Gemmatimonadaceae bacterium]
MLNPRRGFSLVELIVAVVVACAIGAAVLESGVGQQRAFAAGARRAVARDAVRQAAAILSADLRALSPRDGDLYAIAPYQVEFRLLLGASVLCTIGAARDAAVLPPLPSASRLGLTSWVAAPAAGDTLLVLDAASGAWARHVLTTDPAAGASCPVGSGFAETPAEAAAGWRIAFRPPLAPTVRPGAPLRFVRRARYQLYRAADARWYLGFVDCLATRATPCAVVQPVAGPYDAGGLRFAYLDSAGAPAAAPADVAVITVDARASSAAADPGRPPRRDSARAVIAVRD